MCVGTIVKRVVRVVCTCKVWTIAYIGGVAIINWVFVSAPPLTIFGTLLPPAILLAGAIHVLRDFSQREIGNKVVIAILIAMMLSFYTASPAIAFASAGAFLISEIADLIVFTLTQRPLSQRILLSSAVSVPIDTALFFWAVSLSNWRSLLLGIAAKMLSAVLFWAYLRRRERHTAIVARRRTS